MTKKFITLDEVLGKDSETLAALQQAEIDVEKLGSVPVTAVDHKEYSKIKKQCFTMVADGTGGMKPELDDDKLMVKLIVESVDKDSRSDFTFANEKLLKKLEVVTAEAAVGALLSPGEIYNAAVVIQNISGFGEKAKKQAAEEVKN